MEDSLRQNALFFTGLMACFLVGWLVGTPRVSHAAESRKPAKTEVGRSFPAVLPDHSAARPEKPKPWRKKR